MQAVAGASAAAAGINLPSNPPISLRSSLTHAPERLQVRTPKPLSLPPARKAATQDAPQGPWIVESTAEGNRRIRARLHPGQSAAMKSAARFTLMLAGSQGGKTVLGPLWLEREIRLRGAGDYMAVTSTYTLLKQKMLPEFLRLFEQTLKLGKWSKADRVFTFHDGETRVMFGSATNPESLESATAKAAWLDEVGQNQFRLESWDAVQRRLAINEGRVLLTTTPYNSGWLKSEVYDRATNGDADYRVIQFASTLNPSFPQAEMARVERTQQSWKVRMFYKGQFDRPPSAIYPDYIDEYIDRGGHLVSAKYFPNGIPHWWPRFLGMDFGGSNLAKIYLAQDPMSGVYYAYHEDLGGNLTVEKHTAQVWQTLAGGMLVGVWGGTKSEEAWRIEFSTKGLLILPPPVFDVELGIDAVTGLLKERKLLVLDTMRGLRDELGTYSRKMLPDGTVLSEIEHKNRFHRLDALRYLALGLHGRQSVMPVIAYGVARGPSSRIA